MSKNSRRRLEVDGKSYTYVIGKSFVKIDGVGSFSKSSVGHKVHDEHFMVTPGMVADFIRTGKVNPDIHHYTSDTLKPRCQCGKSGAKWRVDPYRLAATEKEVEVLICDECYKISLESA